MNLSFRLLLSFDQNISFFHVHAIYVVEEVIVFSGICLYVTLSVEKTADHRLM